MEEQGGEFRATRDLDLVICGESLDRVFAEVFWEFIRLGKYENRQKSTGKRLFYRFHSPRVEGFPEMLELLARVPEALDFKGVTGIISAGQPRSQHQENPTMWTGLAANNCLIIFAKCVN